MPADQPAAPEFSDQALPPPGAAEVLRGGGVPGAEPLDDQGVDAGGLLPGARREAAGGSQLMMCWMTVYMVLIGGSVVINWIDSIAAR